VIVGQVFLHAQILAMIERGVYDIFTLVQGIVLRYHTIDGECEHILYRVIAPWLDVSWHQHISMDQFRW